MHGTAGRPAKRLPRKISGLGRGPRPQPRVVPLPLRPAGRADGRRPIAACWRAAPVRTPERVALFSLCPAARPPAKRAPVSSDRGERVGNDRVRPRGRAASGRRAPRGPAGRAGILGRLRRLCGSGSRRSRLRRSRLCGRHSHAPAGACIAEPRTAWGGGRAGAGRAGLAVRTKDADAGGNGEGGLSG